MPSLEITPDELVLHLSFWEKLACLRTGLRIPLAHVRGATADDGYDSSALGFRSPGTRISGYITAGTFRKDGDRQFVFVTRRTRSVVIELQHNYWTRLIIGVPDARHTAQQINNAREAERVREKT